MLACLNTEPQIIGNSTSKRGVKLSRGGGHEEKLIKLSKKKILPGVVRSQKIKLSLAYGVLMGGCQTSDYLRYRFR
jgi:hypothetical protein